MHVVHLTVENYGPFKGVHKLILKPSVYGIVARHDNDSGRSNWLGKSWILSAIRYVLYGAHTADSADKVIHNGEAKCSVYLMTSDSVFIKREKERGKSAQLTYTAEGDKPAIQKRAQELIHEYVKMSLSDFDASCYIGQKQIARLVLVRPAVRAEIVSAWLELGPVQKAASYAGEHLRDLLELRTGHLKTIEDNRLIRDQVEMEYGVSESYHSKNEERRKRHDELIQLRADIRTEIHLRTRWTENQKRADEFEELIETGQAKAEELKEVQISIREFELKVVDEVYIAEAHKAWVSAGQDCEAVAVIAKGQFSGICPLMNKLCPVKDKVSASKGAAKTRLLKFTEEQVTSKSIYFEMKKDKEWLTGLKQKEEGIEAELEHVRKDAKERVDASDLIADTEIPGGLYELQTKEEAYEEEISTIKFDQITADDNHARWERAVQNMQRAQTCIDDLKCKLRTAQEATAILGRNGVQKEIAVSALSEIERLANTGLSEASIDLTLAVRWAREGDGLASHCEACGTPFGTSKKIKECPQCNKERGPKMIEKLELELSNRSGAADDMGGLVFQLAASFWLRRKRGSDWSAVFIDEPFGALDDTNAKNLSMYLHTLIRGQFGFEQGFLVSHSGPIMDAMPMKVVVKSDGHSSRLEVE